MKGTRCLTKALFYVLYQLTPLPHMCVKQLSVCLDREKNVLNDEEYGINLMF